MFSIVERRLFWKTAIETECDILGLRLYCSAVGRQTIFGKFLAIDEDVGTWLYFMYG